MRRLFPIKILDRYLIREFLFSYLVCLAVMIALYVVLDLFANIDEFMETSDVFYEILQNIFRYYFYNSFLYYSQIAGMIVVIAIAFTLTRLHRNNETVAMLASGISLYRVSLPVVIMGFVLNGLWFIDQEFIIPSIADKLILSHDQMGRPESFSLWFLKDRDNSLLSVASFDPQGKKMGYFLLIERDSEGRIKSKISAKSAYWDDEERLWRLEGGVRYYRVKEQEDALSAAAAIRSEPVSYYKSDWEPDELVLRQSLDWLWFLSLRQINSLLEKPYLIPNLKEVIAIRHIRFTQPLLNLVMIFLALPFFLNREGTHLLSSIGASIGVSLSCYLITILCQNIATGSSYPGFWVWLPIMIYGPVAVLLMESIRT